MSLGLLDHAEAESVPPPVSMLKIGIIITLFLMVAGGATWAYVHHATEQATIAAAQKAECEWLMKERVRIEEVAKNIKRERAELVTLATENSQPKRKGGKAIPQGQWPEGVRRRFEGAQKDLTRRGTSHDASVATFNLRLEQYRGPWPSGTKLEPLSVL